MMFRPRYALATAALFALELAIALYVHDRFIRPHVGDALAVVLVYLALRTVTTLRVTPATTVALAIACAIEVGQYFRLIDRLGLHGSRAALFVLGSGFDLGDFAAYVAGAAAILAVEIVRGKLAEARQRLAFAPSRGTVPPGYSRAFRPWRGLRRAARPAA